MTKESLLMAISMQHEVVNKMIAIKEKDLADDNEKLNKVHLRTK